MKTEILDEYNRAEFIRSEVEGVFKKYIDNKITDEQFVNKLNSFDNRLKRLFGTKGQKSIWFRLFKGDTLATTIRNIETDLINKHHGNYKCFMESVAIGVNEIGMEVYFS